MRQQFRVIFSVLFLLMAGGSVVFANSSSLAGKKILWVDSYHKGYPWSDGIEMGLQKVLHNSGVELLHYRMNTKVNDSVEFGIEAGKKAYEQVKALDPDLVIATDDNAQKYLIVPFLKDTNLPVVFSGVNWDASKYGYPAANVTGMVEVDNVDRLVGHMVTSARGSRVGFLSVDVETARNVSEMINLQFFQGTMKRYMVKTFSDFKEQFLLAQQEVDMLIIYNYIGLQGWDEVEAEAFVAKHTKIPTGALLPFLKQFAVYTVGKSSVEHGEYAAQTGLDILSGKVAIEDIDLKISSKIELSVNLKMAKSAGIVFPLSVLKTAEVLGREAYSKYAAGDEKSHPVFDGKKILWVDSYHEGYAWSDGVGRGIKEVLVDKGVELQVIRLDTKRNTSVSYAELASKSAMDTITSLKPDLIIASDDNAQKYLVVPYLLGTKTPVIFCGVNWDASMYGYPASNITGMIEVEPVEDLVALMRKYARGDRVGFLSGDVRTERKTAAFYNERIFDGKLASYFVNSVEEFKEVFIRAQTEVDMLIIPSHGGVPGWKDTDMEQFIADNTRIPTGGVLGFMSDFLVFTLAKSPFEHGNYAAKMALEVLGGASPGELPIQKNERNRSTVNLKMAKAAGIVIPVSTLKEMNTVIGQQTLLQAN